MGKSKQSLKSRAEVEWDADAGLWSLFLVLPDGSRNLLTQYCDKHEVDDALDLLEQYRRATG